MSDISPRPAPKVDKPELRPGGADALPVDPDGLGLPRDLPPATNPAAEKVPDEVLAKEPSGQEPDGAADEEIGTSSEDQPAGQLAEDGSVEPPA